jgi:CheY-like chemotaxis protein
MPLKKRVILLVAEDVTHRDRLARRLHDLGCDVVIAENGALGVLAAHAERPSLVIAESQMAVMNGYHMVEALRSDPTTQGIPVILLEPSVDDAAITRCWSHGADFCFSKSAGLSDLLLAIDRTLGEPRPAEYQSSHAYAA